MGKLFNFSNSFMVIVGTAIVIYFGGNQALNHEFSLGTLLIFVTYMAYLIGPVQGIATQITIRRQKLVNVSRVFEVISDHEGVETAHKSSPLPRVRGAIEFQNVSYAYRGNHVINQINLVIPAGQKIGIVGPSGAGKSTLLRLLELYIEPDAGRVLIDGQDIQNVSLHDLRQKYRLS